MCDPLTQLRVQGFLCPFAESEEDYVARSAALTLQSVPLRWYREVKNDGSAKAAVPQESALNEGDSAGGGDSNDFLNSVVNNLARGVDQVAKALSLEDLPPEAHRTAYIGIGATLNVQEGPKGPSIIVTPASDSEVPENVYEFCDLDDSGLQKNTKRVSAPKTVALCDITEVAPGDGFFNKRGRVSCDVRVHGLPDTNGFSAFGVGEAVLLFDVGESTVHGVTRDEVGKHLNDLVEWDKKRRTPPPEAEKVAPARLGKADFVWMDSEGGSRKPIVGR